MVDFSLTKEQIAMKESIGKFCQKEVKPLAAELDRLADPNDVFPMAEKIIKKGVALGLPFMVIPKKYGGLGADNITVGVVFEEMSKADAGFAGNFGISNIAWLPLLEGGTEDQKQKWFKKALEDESGLSLACWAATEPQGIGIDSDKVWETGEFALNLTTKAVPDGDNYRITGEKCFITGGGIAKFCTILADTPGGPSHFIVSTDTPGFKVTRLEDLMGHRAMNNAVLFFDDMVVPKENLISKEEGNGITEMMGVLGYSDAWVAALSIGIAQAAYDAAFEYSKMRIISDKPIIRFQAVGTLIADMAMLIEAARTMVWKALWTNDSEGIPNPRLSALAKVFASDTAMKVTTDAVQVYGGAGYMKENPVEKLMRDAKVTQIYEGTNQVLRNIAATLLFLGV